MPSTHESLIAAMIERDQEAWVTFAERYGSLIRDYGCRRGLQACECDDLLQDVLLSLSKGMHTFRYDPAKGRLRSYLRRIAQHSVARIALRSRLPRGVHSLDAFAPGGGDAGSATATRSALAVAPDENDDSWERAWRQHHLRCAFPKLARDFSERTVRAFRLYALEGLPVGEVADLLGMSVESVYQARSRVLPRLSAIIAEQIRVEG